MNALPRGRLAGLFLVAAIVLGSGLGLRDPWPPDEPRFALVARDMAASGDWLIPSVAGVYYPDKPPLFFWSVAAVDVLGASTEVAFLVPALVAGAIVLWLVYDLARRLWDPQTAQWAGATLLVTVQFPLEIKSGRIDGFLCLWTTLALYGLCRHLLLGPAWRWYAAAGFSCGLGVITKGVGFLPFLILIPYAYARLRRWALPSIQVGGARWALAPLAFCAGIAIWLLPMLVATAGTGDPSLVAYRDEILLRQTLTRFGHPWGHLKPPWYYLTNVLPALWFPVSFLLPWLVPAWLRELRRQAAPALLLVGWIVLVLVFFSLSAGKRSVYVLPAVPALALAVAPHLRELVAQPAVRRFLFGLSLLLAAAIVAAGIFANAKPSVLQRWFDDPADIIRLASIAVGIGAVALAAVLMLGIRRAPAGMAAALAISWIGASLFAYPSIDASRSGKSIMDAVAARLADGELLGLAGWKEQFLLQWDRPAVHFGFRRLHDRVQESKEAASWLTASPRRRLLLPESMARPCFDRAKLIDLGFAHEERWLMASRVSVLAACRAPAGSATPGAVSYLPVR